MRTAAVLLIVAVLAPPIGVPALLLVLVLAVARHLGRDGGVIARREGEALCAPEPWWCDVHEEPAQ